MQGAGEMWGKTKQYTADTVYDLKGWFVNNYSPNIVSISIIHRAVCIRPDQIDDRHVFESEK